MTNAVEKIEAARRHPAVAHVNEWKGRRAYINLKSEDRSFRGVREHQLYIDMETGEVVEKLGKGTYPAQWMAEVDAVIAALS